MEDESTSTNALIGNAMRLLVGVLGFVLLLLICVAVHLGGNACKRYMSDKKNQKREARVVKDSYKINNVLPNQKLSVIESESYSSYGSEESKVQNSSHHLIDINVSHQVIELPEIKQDIVEEEIQKIDINDLGGFDMEIAGLSNDIANIKRVTNHSS